MSQDQKPVKEKSSKSQKPSNNAQGDDFIPRPDRSKFLESLKELRKQLDDARAKLAKHRQEIDAQSNNAQSPEETKLRDEHSAILAERNSLRDAERKVVAEAERIEAAAKRKVTELQALRPKNGPRNVKDLDAKVKQIESSVETGTLSIVEEQRALKEANALKKQRASFGQADKLQAEIDEQRKKAADLRKTIDQAAIRQINARKAEIEKKLDSFKESRQAHRAKMNAAFDSRRKVQAEIKELNAKMDELRKDFDKRMEDFNAKLKARKEQREAEEKQAKAAQIKDRKVKEAQEKLAEAQKPAFSDKIEIAKSMIAFFDPSAASSADSASKSGTATSGAETNGLSLGKKSVSKALKAPSAPQTQTVAPQQAPQAPPSRKSQKMKSKDASAAAGAAPQSTKLQFDFSVVESLSSLNVPLPTSTTEVPNTIEKLKEKIQYYTENSQRVTKERVERAEKELNAVLASAENGTEAEAAPKA